MSDLKTRTTRECTYFRGEFIFPGDASYERARRVWNGMVDKRPALIARCSGTADVMDAVRLARSLGLEVAVRGGGHSVAGLSTCDDCLVIDLSGMNTVRVDPVTRRATVQGGAVWGDVDRETQAFSLVAAGGVVSTTGVAGLTLGGGYGWARRKLGLSCDTLVSVELVTADGRLMTASRSENPDLFWALQGGGGNFGIAVWFEFELFELGPEVFYVSVMYPGGNAAQVLGAWRDVVEQAPEEITSDAAFISVPPLPDIPSELHDRPVVFVEAVYAGDATKGEKAMRPFRELDEPLLDASGPVQWLDLQTGLDPLVPAVSQQYYWKSLYMQDLSDHAIQALVERCVERPSPRTLVPIRHLGGAIQRVGPTQTPIGDRNSKYLLSLDSIWTDPDQTEANVSWTRRVWQDMQPFSARNAVYLNFAGMGEEGQDLLQGAYQKNYDRLVAVKTKYDPDNFFHHNHNIPPAK